MDRKELERHLELIALHLSETQALLAKQEDLVAHMESYGVDTSAARQILEQQRDLLRQHQADWERLQSELEKLT
jgi:endonuclease III